VRAVVVYESMYGNTRLVAGAIGRGLGAAIEVEVVPVHRATPSLLDGAALLVVGGPTHAHSMSRTATRRAAVDAAGSPGSDLTLDVDAEGTGLRDWLAELGQLDMSAAAFDTRVDLPVALTGRAAKRIRRELRHRGFDVVASESFLVDKANHLLADEESRALAWGEQLARATVAAAPSPVELAHRR
jgi:hypothetical protein